jgi:hypothetical protein
MLTQFAITNAKPRTKPYKLPDMNGLHLLLKPTGARLWRFRYRFAGKENTLGFGTFPEVSLAEARGKRDDARNRQTKPCLRSSDRNRCAIYPLRSLTIFHL